jgi:hypothetical protein
MKVKILQLVALFLVGTASAQTINYTQNYPTVCSGDELEVNAAIFSAPNTGICWFSDPDFQHKLGGDFVSNIPYQDGKSFRYTGTFTSNTTLYIATYYYLDADHNNFNIGPFTPTSYSSTIPVAANPSLFIVGNKVCGSGSATIVASGAPEGTEYKWYASNGITLLATSATYQTPSINSNATYFVDAPGYLCKKQQVDVIVDTNTSLRNDFTVTVLAQPCVNDRAQLKVQGVPEGQMFFLTDAQGHILITPQAYPDIVSSSIITQPITLYASYGTPYSSGACASKTITINPANPAPPDNQNFNLCVYDDIELDPVKNGPYLMWYDNNDQFLGKFSKLHVGSMEYAEQRIYKGSLVDPQGCVGTVKATFTLNTTVDCEDELNWIETKGFDENGTIVSNSRSFYDKAGKALQSQTKTFDTPAVFAQQSVADKLGSFSLSTLPAPISGTEFKYNYYFVGQSQNKRYGFADFDLTNKNNPNPVYDAAPGTLGWYYSTNNNLETNVPVTDFPFARSEYYEDGSGETRKSASAGDQLRMGKGHEALSGTFPIYRELDKYVLIRRNASQVNLADNLTVASLINDGVQTIVKDQNDKYGISIADKTGKTVMSARLGTSAADSILTVKNSVTSSGNPASVNYRSMTYFYILQPQVVSITGSTDFVVEDIVNNVAKPAGQTFANAGNGNQWPVGFYRILLNNSSSTITLSFVHYFVDVSYQFYDDAGRLKCSISPNGVKQLKDGVSYSSIDKTTYKYNHQGWLLCMTEPDAGSTKYVYRKDGNIRFSQNAEQKTKSRFSYTHYDDLGRPIESGEYTGTQLTFVAMDDAAYINSVMKAQLEKTYNTTTDIDNATDINWKDNQKDWVRTHYDFPYNAGGTCVPQQDFLRGAVSWSENENTKTVYSYDEFGRVTWVYQKPMALSRTFKTEYTYSFLGNVLQVANLTLNDTSCAVIDKFYHHYEYDKDQRLKKSYTSLDGTDNTKKIRATYSYYLHGPLKRVELGDKLQGVDFVYDISGALRYINNPDNSKDPGQDGRSGSHNDVKADVFGMALDYYESDMNGIMPIGPP